MKNLLLFINGLCLSSIYITSPLLIPSLYNKDVTLRPLSVHDALLLTTTASATKKVQTDVVDDTANNNTSTTTAVLNVSENSESAHDNSLGIAVSTDTTNTQNIPTATINNFVYLLTTYILGKAIGQYLFTKRRKISLAIRSIPIFGRLLQQSRGSRILPPWRIACIAISILVSLVIITGKSAR